MIYTLHNNILSTVNNVSNAKWPINLATVGFMHKTISKKHGASRGFSAASGLLVCVDDIQLKGI